jgi:hypothetical protein
MMMKNMVLFVAMAMSNMTNVSTVYAQEPGSDADSHGCIGSAGYSWCPVTDTCVQVWRTPCPEVDPQFAEPFTPGASEPSLPYVSEPFTPEASEPALLDPQFAVDPHFAVDLEHMCSDVMCDLYCSDGYQVDEKGCPTCLCNENVPTDCVTWYDGCNRCAVQDGVLQTCTMMACFVQGEPECLGYEPGSGH